MTSLVPEESDCVEQIFPLDLDFHSLAHLSKIVICILSVFRFPPSLLVVDSWPKTTVLKALSKEPRSL